MAVLDGKINKTHWKVILLSTLLLRMVGIYCHDNFSIPKFLQNLILTSQYKINLVP